MNELQIFRSDEFGEVRTIEESGKPLFCGADIARALGYARPNEAVTAHSRGTVKRRTPTKGGEQEMLFVTEGDVYRLITHSKLPAAEQFERWVFDEVLPTIRKHGGYLTPEKVEEALLNPDTLIRLATDLKEERARRKALEAQAEADKPKVLFADAVATADTSILVGELAKLLKQNGVEIGQNRLFAWLRENGYLIRRNGADYNMPTQKSMEMGLMEIKERTIGNPDGSVRITKTPKVTGKGQQHFIEKFLACERAG